MKTDQRVDDRLVMSNSELAFGFERLHLLAAFH
jgi:hypothetical protein